MFRKPIVKWLLPTILSFASLPAVGAQGTKDASPFSFAIVADPQIGMVRLERDRENLILLRGKRNFIILNLYPYNSAHLMVVPYLHTSDFTDLDAETVSEMMEMVRLMLRVVSEEYRPEGYNLGMNIGRVAGAGVADHVHMHLVPRWAGDTNFMTSVAEVRVLPESLRTGYDKLKAAWPQ